ncbi:MAG TPA: hemerythrin domain-containing protein [Terriglobales bacterium]|nr:hemerythrin domain-containing protein [Terriglobales bacterium]
MALVSWNPSYSVKVEKCDTDHKKLFDILNKLHEAMSAGNGNQVVAKVVKELGDYTKFHFGA